MSVAFSCSSLPARAFGHKDGRGSTDMVRMPDIVRLIANPPAQACRLKRWNKFRRLRPSADSPPAQSPVGLDIKTESGSIIPSLTLFPKEFEVEIEKDYDPFLVIHKNGDVERLGRFNGAGYVDGSLVLSRDKEVIIDSENKMTVRIYLPHADGRLPPQKLPIVVYFHGGAFIVEDIASPPYHNYLNRLAEKANILIVSVNYRLAPEKFLPVAYDDCMEALNWVASHSARKEGLDDWIFNHGDLGRIFLSGDSAGGNITHNLALREDNNVEIEGIALVHPYFFGKVPVPTEIEDPVNLLFHRKLWPFIKPESEGLDDPQVNPFGPNAPSLSGLKCKRAVVFVAGKDFHSERGKMYIEKLRNSGWDGEMPVLCNHHGVGHVYHLSVEAATEDIEIDAAWKLMTQLLQYYQDNKVDLEDSIVETLRATTAEAIINMRTIQKEMSDRMMEQLVAFYKGDPVPYSS